MRSWSPVRWGWLVSALIFLLQVVDTTPAMAIAFVQGANGADGTGDQSIAFASNNTAGNFIIVVARIGNATSVPTVSDTRGNTYTEDRRQVQTTDAHRTFIFSAPNIAAGANTVTVAIAPSVSTNRSVIHEYSGLATSAALDQVTSAQADGTTSLNSGNVTTLQADELLFGAGSTAAADVWTAGASYTLRQNVGNKVQTEDRIVAATGIYSASLTIDANDNWTCLIATYKGAAAAGGAGSGDDDIFEDESVIPWPLLLGGGLVLANPPMTRRALLAGIGVVVGYRLAGRRSRRKSLTPPASGP